MSNEKIFVLWDRENREKIEVSAKKVGAQWKAICPKHDDTDPSLSINEEKGLYNCFGCGFKGRLYKPGILVATYDYKDENGDLLYQVLRYEPKNFKCRRLDEYGNQVYNLTGIRKVLYRLPELFGSSKEDIAYVVEGEKDVDNLVNLGFIALLHHWVLVIGRRLTISILRVEK